MSHRNLAPTPPMGWNSYDSYGAAINEQEFRANVDVLADKLLTAGYRYAVIDGGWSYDEPEARDILAHPEARPHMDEHGRLVPSPRRFPSAAGEAGFGPLADWVHSRGLKFGIHVMRGIPRLAVQRGLVAADAAETGNTCIWDHTMYGLDHRRPSARMYYDSILALYARWGVDFIKADDMCCPYYRDEIDAFSAAVWRCGRPILLSLSPGVWVDDALRAHAHVGQASEMWRLSGDVWDSWASVRELFPLCAVWSAAAGPNAWPDADMLPYGRLSLKSPLSPGGRPCRLTRDEVRTHFSLLCMAKSPLMMGGDLPSLDEFTLSLLTNPEVLAVHRHSRDIRCPWRKLVGLVAWTARMPDGDAVLAMFNIGEEPREHALHLLEVYLPGRWAVRDLWARQDLPPVDGVLSMKLAPHACAMYRLKRN